MCCPRSREPSAAMAIPIESAIRNPKSAVFVGEGAWKGLRSCGFPGYHPILSRVFKGFPEAHPGKVQNSKPFPLAKERVVNKAELIAALAMRTKMSKADAGRAIESLFDDKGIIAGELKKGAKVQITGFGNFEARKRAARMGRNPKTGAEIQIKATVAPAFRAGKQLKMAVNKK